MSMTDMNDTVILDRQFLLVFCAWFNVDLIDLTDAEEVKNTAGVCASDLMKQHPDPDKLIADLTRALAQWNPSIAMQFIKATNTDWLFDEETEQILKGIVSTIIEGLVYFRKIGTLNH
jgi:hypothetical protein